MPTKLHLRRLLLVIAGLTLSLILVHSFAAQQTAPPFDPDRMVADLTTQLQLDAEQVTRLREIIAARRAQFERLQQQARGMAAGANPAELRAAFERERRAVMEELLPQLRPEQRTRLQALLAAPPPLNSAIAPLRPKLTAAPLSAGEKLIAPVTAAPAQSRNRRAAPPHVLTEDQKILHLLGRAGFGPRPGDIERVRQMGLEHYLEQQLHPENISDSFLAQPLLALSTLQMATPEILQLYPPPPPPRPTPTPTPKPPAAAGAEGKDQPNVRDMAPSTPRPDGQMMANQEKEQPPKLAPQATPPPPPQPPRPLRNPQQPLVELQQAKLLRAVFSERQLLEVMTDFWFNHFNVFAQKDIDRWLLTSYERDVIRPHALGKFKELLLATAQSPAMLYYLDNFLSQAEVRDGATGRRGDSPPESRMGANENAIAPSPSRPVSQSPPTRRQGLNENYARELMELHTLGVDGGYTQQDVIEVARCFTGWGILPQPNTSFVFRPRVHDRGEKTVLGVRFPAGGGIEDGLRVLDILARHPSTARFISRKLCQRFVADDPPAALVERAASVFLKTDGDIREVVRTILSAPEFYAPKYYRNKIKSPLEVVASALRATGAATDGWQPLIQWVARLGEPLYLCQPPTGYSEESAAWINTGTLIERMNFAIALAQNRISGTRVNVGQFLPASALSSSDQTLNGLLSLLLHCDVSTEMRARLNQVLADAPVKLTPAGFDGGAASKESEALIAGLASLILGSREFQVK